MFAPPSAIEERNMSIGFDAEFAALSGDCKVSTATINTVETTTVAPP
jgi:hypothetical protein